MEKKGEFRSPEPQGNVTAASHGDGWTGDHRSRNDGKNSGEAGRYS
jgi:hypothetical protein